VTAVRDPMLPVPYRVAGRRVETLDSATLYLEPVAESLPPFAAGQFTMLYAPGVGEVAISISGDPAERDGCLHQTIRDVGAVSRALHHAEPGSLVGARGPYGRGWDVASAAGKDRVIVAGGVGLAPLRPVVLDALADRRSFGRVVLIIGARRPDEFLFREQIAAWTGRGDLEVLLTVDVPAAGWNGPVGFVTEPLGRIGVHPDRTVAFLCGPEPMMRFSADVLLRKSVPAEQIRVSLERNMKCGVALCGHCQLGPLLVCRDGPVVTYDQAAPLLTVREL
jgi:NAD(P)H-flavin reductase